MSPCPITAAWPRALGRGKFDLAWLGGFSYVQARQLGEVRPIAQREEDPNHTSVFVVHEDSHAHQLKRPARQKLCLWRANQRRRPLDAALVLQRDGLRPETDFRRLRYSGSHEVTALWVATGKVEAGVLGSAGWQRLVDSDKLDLQRSARAGHHAGVFW